MALRFVLGRSGAGKTQLCLNEIRRELELGPDGPPLIMLVPEQATFQTEYTLARTPGLAGTIRAQVMSFRRLAFRVMQETGGTALVPISDNGKNMLLYKIVQRLGPELKLFSAGLQQQGFIERLNELLTEFKRYGVTPDTLDGLDQAESPAAKGSLLGGKLHDVQLVFREMEDALQGLYMDAEDSLGWLASGFPHVEYLRSARIWVDGFHGFTPKEIEALGVMMSCAADVTVALCLDRPYGPGEKPHELDLFHPTAETYNQLFELARAAGVDLLQPVLLNEQPLPRFADSPMLDHLERHFRSRMPLLVPDEAACRPEDPRCGISIHAAVHRRAEVEAVARDIVRRVQQGDLRWRDIAVMVRTADDYNDYIAAVFGDYGIPVFLDQKQSVNHHPLVELIRSALETVNEGWRYEAVFRCAKTEMLLGETDGVDREALDRLENYVLAAGIDGWRWLDDNSWKPLMQDALEDEPEQAREMEPERFGELLRSRDSIVRPLEKLANRLKKAHDVKGMCTALYRLLDEAGAADRLEAWSAEALEKGEVRRARQHRQLWDGVMDLLDQLVELAGDESVTPELFAGMVETGLDSLKLASVPPAVDQVLAGSMDRTRSTSVHICYVLGANDGVMPMRIQEDGLLTEQERERLTDAGIRVAPSVRRRLLDERFLIYVALTTPCRHLWISYALSDEEGKSLLPSEVIRHVKLMFPGIKERIEGGEPSPDMPEEEQLGFIRHPERTLSYLITQLRAWRQGAQIADFWWDIYNWYAKRPQWHDRLLLLTGSLSFYNEEAYLTGETARLLYGDHLKASVSRMERFVACPFQHFVSHGLRLQERRLYRLEAPDIGQLFHAALSRLAQALGSGYGSMAPGQIRQAAGGVVDELAPRLQSSILLSSSRYQYISEKLKQIVAQAAIVLGEHARRAAFKPVGLEVGFGPGGQLPSLQLPLKGGRSMEIVGRIDRVDAAETEDGLLLRVLDYKSSETQLRLEDVVHGLTLQMLTYLDVLLTHAEGWLGRPALPAGVLYFHVHNPLLGTTNNLSEKQAGDLMLKRFKMKGLLLAEEHAVRLMDGDLESGHSELLPAALKKDGGFYSFSSVVSRDQWQVLRGSVRTTIKRIGSRIMDGEITIAPYRIGAKMPCQFCSYKPVCQFDPLFEGNRYVKLSKPPKDQIWQLLEAGAAESAEGAEVRGGSGSKGWNESFDDSSGGGNETVRGKGEKNRDNEQ
ncbi:helicase-exonuclease AddAB subunit AddB [Paenibacillus sambharensis]|uniref:ATP-dependent helicase/deoxyribonuclease subunit B n=1 Tax=Paenibacillus sambharensis TaxID=1803190 RepID=A0A2W1LRA3_9BACL|nr:helicase-exonuclease AddAB subunit AddB [Paenibacillus sambharensis]PZD93947.1 helicase-exonuclease AddAB subunit AddB [Paenibacillus sambharensis]